MEKDVLTYHLSKVLLELKSRMAEEIVCKLLKQNEGFVGTPTNTEKLLTADQLCENLQISNSHFYSKLRNLEHFPVYDLVGAKRYKQSEVEQFIKNLKT